MLSGAKHKKNVGIKAIKGRREDHTAGLGPVGNLDAFLIRAEKEKQFIASRGGRLRDGYTGNEHKGKRRGGGGYTEQS